MTHSSARTLGGRWTVPSGWRTVTLDEIKSPEPGSCAAGPFGSSISRKYFVESGVPVIRGNNLTKDMTPFVPNGFVFVTEERTRAKYQRCVVQSGDLVFTCWGTIGQVGLIPNDGPHDQYVISNKQLKLRVDPEHALSRFVYYYLASATGVEYLESRASGAAVPGINLGVLKSISIGLPPLSTQTRIADILSAYDDLIENNNRRMALLEEAIHLLYREWFVYLRFPGHERVKVVDGVPEGWGKEPLREVCDVTMGQSPKSEFYNEEGQGLPFHQGVKDYGERFVIHRVFCTVENRVAEAGDVLFSVRAPVGRLNITKDRIVIGRGLCAFRRRDGHQSFQFYQLKSHFHQEDLIGGGTIFASVTKKNLLDQEILAPTESLVAEFEVIAADTDRQILNLDEQNQRLREARDLLLPRLMNGSIAV